jgi:hypothetical protein
MQMDRVGDDREASTPRIAYYGIGGVPYGPVSLACDMWHMASEYVHSDRDIKPGEPSPSHYANAIRQSQGTAVIILA